MAIFPTRSYDQGIWKQVCICLKEFHHIFLSRYIGVNDIYYYAKLHKILRKRNTFQDPISFFQNHTFPSHKNINCCERESSEILCHNMCEKWYESNMDFQNVQRSFGKWKITNLHKSHNQNVRSLNILHDYSSC